MKLPELPYMELNERADSMPSPDQAHYLVCPLLSLLWLQRRGCSCCAGQAGHAQQAAAAQHYQCQAEVSKPGACR